MNPHEPPESFEAARRRHLIEATIEALADVGFKAASLSQIARRADVSTGLFAHYFGDKDGLLEATLRFMAARLVQATRNRLRAARTPRERLYAVPDSALADTEFERRTSAVWLAFWGQITHSARYQRIQFIYQRRMLSNLKHDLRKVVAADRVETYAEMIAAMIDGVWIRSHASATPREGSEARVLVRGLIDGLIARATDEGEKLEPPPTIVRVQKMAPSKSSREKSSHEKSAHDELALRRRIEAARAAQRTWNAQSAARRAETLRRIAHEIEANRDELARLEARTTRQPVKKIAALCVPRLAAQMRIAATQVEARRTLRIEHSPDLFEHHEPSPPAVLGLLGRCDAPLLGLLSPLACALRDGHASFLAPGAASFPLAERIVALAEGAGAPPALVQCLPGASPTELPGDVYRAPAAQPPRTATVVCEDADVAAVAAQLARGLMPWAAGPDLGQTPVFVAARILPRVERAVVEALGRLAAGDPLDPATEVARSSLAAGDEWEQALAGGAARRHPSPACDVLTWDRASPICGSAPGLSLIPYSNQADLLARLEAGAPWDTLGLLYGADGPARQLANQLPATTRMGIAPEPGSTEFVTLVAASGPLEPSLTRRIFWGAEGRSAINRPEG